MTFKEKYKELVELLEEVGVMQLDTDWAERIQELVAQHSEDGK